MRSKRYKQLAGQIDKNKNYPFKEALKLVKATAGTKFDSALEVHIRLGIDPKKGEQAVRGNVVLPHGTGKSKRVAVFCQSEKGIKGADIIGSEEMIKNIIASGKADFDVVLATPEMMNKLAGAAKVLGPKGLMPSPKAGTVVDESELNKAIDEIKRGRVNFKNDDGGNLHQLLGKVSWEDKKLEENYRAFVEAVRKVKPSAAKGNYILGITLTSTMGPGVKVSLEP